MKHQIAQLKQRRKKLRKKFFKEAQEKREINKQIKQLLKDTTEKHQAELKQLGIAKTSQPELSDDDLDVDE